MIVIVTGPPCSGKSTWAWEERGPEDVVVDYDAMTKAFGSAEHHAPPESIGQVAFAARAAAVARVFDGVEADAFIIQSNLDQKAIDKYVDAGCVFKVLDPGLDECLARAEADGRPEGTEQRIRDWYDNPPEVADEHLLKGGTVKTKTMTVQLKADGDLDEGQFTGYAAVFGNKDSYGDVILKGAFEETLGTYGPGGAGVPVYWSHRMDDPMMNIGQTVEAKEDDRGLFVKVQLDLETPQGAQVHKLIKTGRVSQMSFAYDMEDYAFAESEELGHHVELRKLKLHEVSVVPVGANQETELLAVKQSLAAAKAGRKLSARNEAKLKQAHDLVGEVLATVNEESDDEGVSDEEPKSAKPEEPETAKGEERTEVKARNGNPDAALAHLYIIDMEGVA